MLQLLTYASIAEQTHTHTPNNHPMSPTKDNANEQNTYKWTEHEC